MKLTENPQASAYGKSLVGYNLIGGEETESSTGRRFASHNPSFLPDQVGTFPVSDARDWEKAIDAATRAFAKWKNVPAPVRASIIGELGRRVTDHKEELSLLLSREIGKTPKEARGEVQEVIDTCQFFQSEGRRLYGMTVPSEMRNKELFTYRKPYGVVAVITASNFPIAVPSWKIIPALLCGNSVVWKTPAEAPAIAYLFGKLLAAAGVPAGVVNVVHGDVATAQALLPFIDAGKIHKVSFTGSSRVGKIIGETCGRNLQTPSLELGGKNPMVVMDDADLDLAVEGALWAGFGTAGQRCTSLGNLILHRPIADAFKKKFLRRVGEIVIGNPHLGKPVLYGPMIAEHYMEHFLAHVEPAKKDGPTMLTPHGRIDAKNKPASFVGDPAQGYYVLPVVWDGVKIDHWVAQEEVFGPCVPILEARDLDEAIAFANGTRYGLSSSIYTNGRQNAYRFKTEIQSGMCSINNSTTGAEAHLPFGGVKNSGNGTRESGVWVIDAYTQWQAVNDELSGKLQLAQMDTESVQTNAESLSLRELVPHAG